LHLNDTLTDSTCFVVARKVLLSKLPPLVTLDVLRITDRKIGRTGIKSPSNPVHHSEEGLASTTGVSTGREACPAI
jgi:hypothetical protein